MAEYGSLKASATLEPGLAFMVHWFNTPYADNRRNR